MRNTPSQHQEEKNIFISQGLGADPEMALDKSSTEVTFPFHGSPPHSSWPLSHLLLAAQAQTLVSPNLRVCLCRAKGRWALEFDSIFRASFSFWTLPTTCEKLSFSVFLLSTYFAFYYFNYCPAKEPKGVKGSFSSPAIDREKTDR